MHDKINKTMRSILIIMCILLMLVSSILIIYPLISKHQQAEVITQAVADWKKQQTAAINTAPIYTAGEGDPTIPTEPILPDLLEAMEAYNVSIYEKSQDALVDAWSYRTAVFDLTQYGLEDGPVGIISIPAIDVEMSLYLGATEQHMAQGFAQLSQTSMPIGGINTNCVVAGHRGWRGAAYMKDANLLQIGDMVYLENFWGTLEYRICEFKTILPYETDEVLIQPGRDLLTLVTCTPYGVGSHRILIFCERVLPD